MATSENKMKFAVVRPLLLYGFLVLIVVVSSANSQHMESQKISQRSRMHGHGRFRAEDRRTEVYRAPYHHVKRIKRPTTPIQTFFRWINNVISSGYTGLSQNNPQRDYHRIRGAAVGKKRKSSSAGLPSFRTSFVAGLRQMLTRPIRISASISGGSKKNVKPSIIERNKNIGYKKSSNRDTPSPSYHHESESPKIPRPPPYSPLAVSNHLWQSSRLVQQRNSLPFGQHLSQRRSDPHYPESVPLDMRAANSDNRQTHVEAVDSSTGNDNTASERVPYSYRYQVMSGPEGTAFQQSEDNKSGATAGSYSVALPDGRVQQVVYRAGGEDGFRAEVKYLGKAHHPSPSYDNPSRNSKIRHNKRRKNGSGKSTKPASTPTSTSYYGFNKSKKKILKEIDTSGGGEYHAGQLNVPNTETIGGPNVHNKRSYYDKIMDVTSSKPNDESINYLNVDENQIQDDNLKRSTTSVTFPSQNRQDLREVQSTKRSDKSAVVDPNIRNEPNIRENSDEPIPADEKITEPTLFRSSRRHIAKLYKKNNKNSLSDDFQPRQFSLELKSNKASQQKAPDYQSFVNNRGLISNELPSMEETHDEESQYYNSYNSMKKTDNDHSVKNNRSIDKIDGVTYKKSKIGVNSRTRIIHKNGKKILLRPRSRIRNQPGFFNDYDRLGLRTASNQENGSSFANQRWKLNHTDQPKSGEVGSHSSNGMQSNKQSIEMNPEYSSKQNIDDLYIQNSVLNSRISLSQTSNSTNNPSKYPSMSRSTNTHKLKRYRNKTPKVVSRHRVNADTSEILAINKTLLSKDEAFDTKNRRRVLISDSNHSEETEIESASRPEQNSSELARGFGRRIATSRRRLRLRKMSPIPHNELDSTRGDFIESPTSTTVAAFTSSAALTDTEEYKTKENGHLPTATQSMDLAAVGAVVAAADVESVGVVQPPAPIPTKSLADKVLSLRYTFDNVPIPGYSSAHYSV